MPRVLQAENRSTGVREGEKDPYIVEGGQACEYDETNKCSFQVL